MHQDRLGTKVLSRSPAAKDVGVLGDATTCGKGKLPAELHLESGGQQALGGGLVVFLRTRRRGGQSQFFCCPVKCPLRNQRRGRGLWDGKELHKT